MVSVLSLIQQITEWHKEQVHRLSQLETLIDNICINNGSIYSYFTYAITISHTVEQDSYLLGSMHVQNISNHVITNPLICLKISATSPFDFSGKYIYPNTTQKMQVTGAWERINEATNKEEYWLRPTHKQVIEPGETITFSNFQLKWKVDQQYNYHLYGYVYSDEYKDGVPTKNQINVNGKVEGEDSDVD